MAIKIIRKPSKIYRIVCENCEAVLEYNFNDIDSGAIQCPCCRTLNDHRLRIKMPKESETTE